jgi:acetylornithine deacetylase/succinyl-diaminopimelate desuccinylase-like protein
LRDDKIYGHGVMDMKSGLAGLIAAACSIQELGADFAGEIIVAGVCDHMGPQQKGSVDMFNKYSGDMCILGELTNSTLCLGHRGREYIDISTVGRSAHTCQKHQAVNAIKTMMPVVDELLKLNLYPDIEPYVKELVGGELYTEVGRIFGGLWPGGPSMIPDKCTIRLDARPQPGVDFSYVENAVNEALERARARDPEVRLEVVIADRKKPYLVPLDAKITQSVKKAVEFVQKKEAKVYAESWLADTSSFGDKIETVIFGPGGGSVYMPNEFLPAQDIRDAARIYTLGTLYALDALQ